MRRLNTAAEKEELEAARRQMSSIYEPDRVVKYNHIGDWVNACGCRRNLVDPTGCEECARRDAILTRDQIKWQLQRYIEELRSYGYVVTHPSEVVQ